MEALIVPIGFVIFFGVIIYFNTQHQNKIKRAWRAFAVSHNLRYSDDPEISGTYKTHYLYMDSFYQNKTTFSRIKFVKPKEVTKPPTATQAEARDMVNSLMTTSILGIQARGYLNYSLREPSITYSHPRFGQNVVELKRYFQPLMDRLDKYVAVGHLGATAIPLLLPFAERENDFLNALSDGSEGKMATQLITDIGAATDRLSYSQPKLICPDCLVRFADQTVKLSLLNRVTYHACRYCQQSLNFLQGNQVVAVLDADMVKLYEEPQGNIRVNWLERRSLFDFDSVQIVQATDEDVERFAVQVGNDTDAYRVERYGRMECSVSSEIQLSQNTIRILEKTFGSVLLSDELRYE